MAELEEMFVVVPFFENYAVSNYGRVISLRAGVELRQWHNKTHNKMKVRFHVLGAYTDVFVEDLVAEAFFLNYKKGISIYHINGNVQDCTVLNLSFDPKYKREEDGSEHRGIRVDSRGKVRNKK